MAGLFKKRTLAYLADYFVVTAIMWIIAKLVFFAEPHYSVFITYDSLLIILTPILGMVYFIVLEAKMGTTVGKHLLFLKVVSSDNVTRYQDISFKQAIIRNVSKIYWLPIIIDLIIGRLVGSSNERILGRLSRTEVVREETET